MKTSSKPYLIFIRYLILLSLMFSLPLIYFIFSPLTIYSSGFLLDLVLHNVSINGNIITLNLQTFIQIIPACIAGSAYLLLLILNLTIPMRAKQRLYTLLFSFALLLILNIFRIFILSLLYYNDFVFFDFTHKLLWYVLSIVFVVLIWLLTLKIYSIKKIPVYSDLRSLVKSKR